MHNSRITPDLGGKILSGGARLYGFEDDDFVKVAAADAATTTPSATP